MWSGHSCPLPLTLLVKLPFSVDRVWVCIVTLILGQTSDNQNWEGHEFHSCQ